MEQDVQTIWSLLESSGVAVAMREWTWLYPIIEIAHIIGFVVLVGAAFLFDLRLLGISRGLPVTHLARHLLGWSRASLFVVVPTGFLMFMTNATKLVQNPVFRVKLILIILAGINALIFHLWTSRSVEGWNVNEASPFVAKSSAVFSLVLWAAVISCGRLIAFF
ncbi:MAG TPA: DUF6644 family protein [Pyrinomonadaceae bacterium]|nr:DUF6644 family protein [Pyrinomonadaceae bacterium]